MLPAASGQNSFVGGHSLAFNPQGTVPAGSESQAPTPAQAQNTAKYAP